MIPRPAVISVWPNPALKNIFLTKNKTIARKVEELIIVWLIESNRLVSKERMLEVYFNTIEWGPGIYGIGEASRFYFSKHPSQLTLEESMFLAMIVPRPKAFTYSFDENGKLKVYTQDFFRVIASHLVAKNVITEDQKNNLNFDVELKGEAKKMLQPKQIDIIENEQEFDEFN